ncbi:MAG: CHAT domain-containing protein [Gammaproteobacteria bacterium]
MRTALALVLLCFSTVAAADWRAEVLRLAFASDADSAVALAEAERTPWLAPHIARILRPPDAYLGWVLTPTHAVAYLAGDEPAVRVLPLPDSFGADVRELAGGLRAHGPTPQEAIQRVRAALFEPIADWLVEHPAWVFAPDGVLASLPWPLISEFPVVLAVSERGAALSSHRAVRARDRPPTLLAYARTALPAARAEIELAARALGGDATLLSGPGALDVLRAAAYDGTLSAARFILVAAHAEVRDGAIVLELGAGADARYAPSDTVHLQFGAELVVLSACETAVGARFAHAAIFAGVGQTLLTQWRIDDAASAQFVAALFTALGRGTPVHTALTETQLAFAGGHHGARYAHPYYWAGWVLWGGL